MNSAKREKTHYKCAMFFITISTIYSTQNNKTQNNKECNYF